MPPVFRGDKAKARKLFEEDLPTLSDSLGEVEFEFGGIVPRIKDVFSTRYLSLDFNPESLSQLQGELQSLQRRYANIGKAVVMCSILARALNDPKISKELERIQRAVDKHSPMVEGYLSQVKSKRAGLSNGSLNPTQSDVAKGIGALEALYAGARAGFGAFAEGSSLSTALSRVQTEASSAFFRAANEETARHRTADLSSHAFTP